MYAMTKSQDILLISQVEVEGGEPIAIAHVMTVRLPWQHHTVLIATHLCVCVTLAGDHFTGVLQGETTK